VVGDVMAAVSDLADGAVGSLAECSRTSIVAGGTPAQGEGEGVDLGGEAMSFSRQPPGS